MKKYFNKYQTKAMFVSIACRDTETSQKTAIAKYQIDWINLLNNDEKLTKTYGIEGYPTKIIVNPEGVVVGKYLGEGTEFYTEMDRLFKKQITR